MPGVSVITPSTEFCNVSISIIPESSLMSLCRQPSSSTGSHRSAFCHDGLEYYVEGTKLWTLFLPGFLLLAKLFWCSSMLLLVSLVYFTALWYCTVWLPHSLFIHSSIDGHLSNFQFEVIIIKALRAPFLQVFVWTRVFILMDKYLGVELVIKKMS